MSDDYDMFFLDNPDDGEDDDWFPADFLADDISDDDIELLHNIQSVLGQSVRGLIEDLESLQTSGRAGQLRGVRFASGGEALIWLFRRGIFLYSSLVHFPDGSWGVAIGSSQGQSTAAKDEGDISQTGLPF